MSNKPKLFLYCFLSIAQLTSMSWTAEQKDSKSIPYLSPEDEQKSFLLPDGYKMELVLSDPVIKEPVICVFDGNGRMYVAEMRSYMQELDTKAQKMPLSRVSRHECSNKDGVFDTHTLFVRNLILPRMVLPLDARVLINQTDSNDIFAYSDTDGDGKADKTELFYLGGPRGGNLEHQPSGLIWGMDNWLYTTVNNYRLRYDNGKALKETITSNGGQWGLCQDNQGKIWFSNAGGEKGLFHFQVPAKYAALDYSDQFPASFLEVWPAVRVPDVQGGPKRIRPDNTLNHFTASCGQEIFRGDRLPADLIGDALICEPVGRLIRRAKVTVREGITYLSNPYEQDKSEFIRSTDPNFRPVNMTTGPDGCLYICDMYRGIIQEGNWVQDGSYLRKIVKEYDLDQNAGRGRIWRLVHKDYKPGPQPRMLNETPAEWVAHLQHPNGWWRDTAQKLLVLSGDTSVVPLLKEMAESNSSPLARSHALWTLEGLKALDGELILKKYKDSTPSVRCAALRASESLKNPSDKLQRATLGLLSDSDADVVLQAMMTAKELNLPGSKSAMAQVIKNSNQKGPRELGKMLVDQKPAKNVDVFNTEELKILSKGETIFKEICFQCHGYDGKGMELTGAEHNATIAPALAGSRLLMGNPDAGALVLLKGLQGTVNGKTFDAQMVPMADNSDEWIAAVLSYTRNSFGNRGAMISPQRIAQLRRLTEEKLHAYTTSEIDSFLPATISSKEAKNWHVSASHNSTLAALAIDGNSKTRYETGKAQEAGMWFQLQFPQPITVSGLRMESGKVGGEYPRAFNVKVSMDGEQWLTAVSDIKGSFGVTEIVFEPFEAKFVRITQTESGVNQPWAISECKIYGDLHTDDNSHLDRLRGKQETK